MDRKEELLRQIEIVSRQINSPVVTNHLRVELQELLAKLEAELRSLEETDGSDDGSKDE